MTCVPGTKHDAGKPRWDLLPMAEVAQVVDALTYGANKYTDNGWQVVETPRERYFAAAMRHITAWWTGEKLDPESGKHHLAHAVCCLLFLMWHDDNQVPGPVRTWTTTTNNLPGGLLRYEGIVTSGQDEHGEVRA
jgi:hypothetical protein